MKSDPTSSSCVNAAICFLLEVVSRSVAEYRSTDSSFLRHIKLDEDEDVSYNRPGDLPKTQEKHL
jgi:hypothetical protein